MLVMKGKVRKAVLPVAGLGTRFLPATKAMPKELMPIINKPLVQYAAEEAVAAGIDTLIFVTGRHKRAIEDHFDNNKELETVLREQGMADSADMVKNILPDHVQCIFVRQPEQLGLGHAILCAERAVGNEPFVVLLADDFLVPKLPNVTMSLIEAYNLNGKSQLSVLQVSKDEVTKYGILIPGLDKGSVSGIVEKPSEEDAPSNFASIGRYLLTPEIFDILRDLEPGRNNEIQLVDAIHRIAQGGFVASTELDGERFDCGSIEGYLDALERMKIY